jgi:hypothetical protein
MRCHAVIGGEWSNDMRNDLRGEMILEILTWRTESQKKISQSVSSLLKLAAEAWLESHCANSSLHWNDY